MKSTVALLSLLGGAIAGGVTESIAPDNSYPDGCSKSFDGEFEVTIEVVATAAKRSLQPVRRSTTCSSNGILLVTLDEGVLTDSKNRTGYIASNYQFQFDDPPQSGAIYTAGFSVCGNDSLALGPTTTFYQCKSGSFWNLYDRNWAEQCEAVQIVAIPCDSSSAAASESADGQVIATDYITTTVVQTITDGQVQVVTTSVAVPMCQIGDGQVQVQTTPCSALTTATTAAATTAVAAVSQYSDGQIQVTPIGTTATAAAGTTTAAAGTTTAAAGTGAAAGTTAVAAGSTAAAGTTAAASTAVVCGSGSSGSGCSSNSTTFSTSSPSTTAAAGTTTSAAPAASSTAATSNAVRTGMASFAVLTVAFIGAVMTL